MDNPFSYPSLAFGAEGLQLGAELNRYHAFQNETIEEEDMMDSSQDDTLPAPVGAADDEPPTGGQESTDTTSPLMIVTGIGIVALTVYVLNLVGAEDLGLDGFPTF
tara:strand:- start:3133 stop:3450 length:318 start_codon:yes stop_codon:yes gene_type:complete